MTQQRRNKPWAMPAALFAAVATAALFLAARPAGYAADNNDPGKATSPLDYVPADAAAVVSIRWADCWDHPVLKPGLRALTTDVPGVPDNFHRYYGIEPADIDREVLFSLMKADVQGPYGPSLEPCVLVTTRKPYDRKTILDAAAPGAREEKIKDRTYYAKEGGVCYVFLDDRTYVIGMESFLKPYLSLPTIAKEGPMAPVLKLAAEKHPIVVGIDVGAIVQASRGGRSAADLKVMQPLLKAQLATLTVDLDGQVKAEARANFAREADAKEGAAGLDDDLDMVRGGFVEMMKQLDKEGDAPKLTTFLKEVQAVLRNVKAEQKGAVVEIKAALKLDPDAAAGAFAEAIKKMHNAAKGTEISNDLKQLALAAINHADEHGGKMLLPAKTDRLGNPLLSWRVLILPYIGEEELYKQFHLDEPWDSEHNKKLLEKMPAVFAPADSEAFKKHETFFQAFVGAGSVFDGRELQFPGVDPRRDQPNDHVRGGGEIRAVDEAGGHPLRRQTGAEARRPEQRRLHGRFLRRRGPPAVAGRFGGNPAGPRHSRRRRRSRRGFG